MADQFRTKCKCGFTGEVITGAPPGKRVQKTLSTKEEKPKEIWKGFVHGHEGPIQSNESTEYFTWREKLAYRIETQAEQIKWTRWPKKPTLFESIKRKFFRLAPKWLVPYDMRSRCPHCKQWTLKSYHTAYLD